MDFVDWCEHFLATVVRMEKDSLATRQMGVFFVDFLNELADGVADQRLTDAAVLAEAELRKVGLRQEANRAGADLCASRLADRDTNRDER